MPIVVEDGSGLANANSYASAAEAASYHSTYGNSAWREPAAVGRIHLPTQPAAGNTVTVGVTAYQFVSGSPLASKDVRLGATSQETQANLVAAINGTGNRGYAYHSATPVNSDATASDFSSDVCVLTTIAGGSAANATALAMTTASPATNYVEAFSGGIDSLEPALMRATRYLDLKYAQRWYGDRANEEQALAWPREGVVDRDGFELPDDAVPVKLKYAVAEAALAILLGADPIADVAVDASTGTTSESISVGPISISESYGGSKATETRYRKVESWLSDLASGGSQAVRG